MSKPIKTCCEKCSGVAIANHPIVRNGEKFCSNPSCQCHEAGKGTLIEQTITHEGKGNAKDCKMCYPEQKEECKHERVKGAVLGFKINKCIKCGDELPCCTPQPPKKEECKKTKLEGACQFCWGFQSPFKPEKLVECSFHCNESCTKYHPQTSKTEEVCKQEPSSEWRDELARLFNRAFPHHKHEIDSIGAIDDLAYQVKQLIIRTVESARKEMKENCTPSPLQGWEEKFNEFTTAKPWELDKDGFYVDASPERLKDFISSLLSAEYEKGYKDGGANVMADFHPATENLNLKVEDKDNVHSIVQKVVSTAKKEERERIKIILENTEIADGFIGFSKEEWDGAKKIIWLLKGQI